MRAPLGRKHNTRTEVRVLLTPPPLPTGNLYAPQYRTHQETKMTARRAQRLTSTISLKNMVLWTVWFMNKQHGNSCSSFLWRKANPRQLHYQMYNFKFNLLSARGQLKSLNLIRSSYLYQIFYHAMRFFWLFHFCLYCPNVVRGNHLNS